MLPLLAPTLAVAVLTVGGLPSPVGTPAAPSGRPVVVGVAPSPGGGPATSILPSGARSVGPPGTSAGAVWVAPVEGEVRVLRAFDPPPKPWLPGHRGVDLEASPGDLVRAAGAGTVTFASELAGRGVVVVQHPDGRRTTYEPVAALVSVGDAVAAGDPLGELSTGDTHCGGIPSCLHWGLRRGFDYLDPLRLIDPGRPVLLPP